jgi:O-antigen/teichoic acid export membrane protein
VLRQLLRDGALYGSGTLLARGLTLLLLPVYTQVLSPTDYGVIELLLILSAFAGVVVALEISQAVARYFWDAEPGERGGYASTALWFTAATYTGFLVVAVATASVVADAVIGDAEYANDVRVAALSVWAGSFFYLAQNQLRWELRPVRYGVASVVYATAAVATTVIFVVWLDLGVAGVFLGYLSGSVLGSVVALSALRGTYSFSFDRDKLRRMLRFSAPLVLSSMGVLLTTYIDRIMISRLLGNAELGIYAVAFRLAAIVSLPLLALQMALTPLVYSRHREPDAPAELARIFRFFAVVALSAFIALSLFADELVTALAAPAYSGAADLVPLLVPAILFAGMYVLAPGLFLAERTVVFGAINVGTAIVNVALILLLIPPFGLEGAAVATLVSACGGFVATMTLSQRSYAVPHEWARLAEALIVATGVVAGAVALGLLSSPAWSPGTLTTKAALTVVGIASVALLLVKKEERARALAWQRPHVSRWAQKRERP